MRSRLRMVRSKKARSGGRKLITKSSHYETVIYIFLQMQIDSINLILCDSLNEGIRKKTKFSSNLKKRNYKCSNRGLIQCRACINIPWNKNFLRGKKIFK